MMGKELTDEEILKLHIVEPGNICSPYEILRGEYLGLSRSVEQLEEIIGPLKTDLFLAKERLNKFFDKHPGLFERL